jgi:hypothetical protein
MRTGHSEQEYIIRINFCSYNSKKVKIKKFGNFWFLPKYEVFQLNLYVQYLVTGTIFEAEIFTVETTHQALLNRILFSQFKKCLYFFWEKPRGADPN